MTENRFDKAICWLNEAIEYGEERHNAPYEEAIQALEEIQQYRAIGLTPTMVKDLIASEKKAHKIALENADILDEYKAIGTIEEFRALREKNEPKKPKMIGYRKDGEPVYECGCCGSTLKVADQPFCMICSCKLDWQ